MLTLFQLNKILISDRFVAETRMKMNDDVTSDDPQFYGAVSYNVEDQGTSHVSVLDGDGMAVAVTSTINLQYRK